MKNSVVLKPRLSEKVYAISENERTYAFDVSRSANANDIASAVKTQYSVEVDSVRLANAHGKRQRSVRRGGRSVRHFHRSDIRKAYVTLKEGSKLPLFAAAEEASKKVDDKREKK